MRNDFDILGIEFYFKKYFMNEIQLLIFNFKEISVTDLERINKTDDIEIDENNLYKSEKARRLSSGILNR